MTDDTARADDHGNPDHPMKQWDAGWQAAFAAIRAKDPDALATVAAALAAPAPLDVDLLEKVIATTGDGDGVGYDGDYRRRYAENVARAYDRGFAARLREPAP